MWSQVKSYWLLIAGCWLLAGCGFQPVYGNKSTSGAATLAGVQVTSIEGRMGQQFRADLEDRLNPGGILPAKPQYRLDVTLKTSLAGIGVARDGTISRYNVYLDSTYELYRSEDGQKITSGTLRHASSYNNLTNAYFSTYIAEEDALKRGITELAELYRQRLVSAVSAAL